MDDAEFLNLVLADAEPVDDQEDGAAQSVPEALTADPERWRIVLTGLTSEAMADITATNVEIQDCTINRRGKPKLVKLKEKRVDLIDRKGVLDGRLRIAKALQTAKFERERQEREATKPVRQPRPIADLDGTEIQQMRAHLKEVFRLMEILEGSQARVST